MNQLKSKTSEELSSETITNVPANRRVLAHARKTAITEEKREDRRVGFFVVATMLVGIFIIFAAFVCGGPR